jgi:hypothetical protein
MLRAMPTIAMDIWRIRMITLDNRHASGGPGNVCRVDERSEPGVLNIAVAPRDVAARMSRAWVAWSGWSVPSRVKWRSARNCASMRFSYEA